MTQMGFKATLDQQIALSMAYLAYSGEKIISNFSEKESIPKEIFDIINNTIPKISVLCVADRADWKIVWGPAIYTLDHAILQDNMMFVARSISNPLKYVVAVRGTNGLAMLDWLKEDFEVWSMVSWSLPEGINAAGSPKISKATYIGFDALLHKMKPAQGLPGNGQDISEYLTEIALKDGIQITFTGHSLAGALAPVLALWFRQNQNINGGWDADGNAQISVIPFAGATPGNQDFTDYFSELLGRQCQRIWNSLDIVPHAWETSTLEELPKLYTEANIEMPEPLKLLLDFIEVTVSGYEQPPESNQFRWTIQKEKDSYMSQAKVQHTHSYPVVLGVPELNSVIDKGKFFEE